MASFSPLRTRSSWTSIVASLCFVGTSFAQGNAPIANAIQDGPFAGQKAPAGVKVGTEKWIVHFEERPFDLAAFRAEMQGDRDPQLVATIVRELERKMKAHQKAFAQRVEQLGGSVVAQWWLVNGCAIEIAPKHLAALRATPNVAYLQPDSLHKPLIKTATNAANHNSDALNARGIRGAGVATAVVDTGHDSSYRGTGRPHMTYRVPGTTTSRLIFNKQLGRMAADDTHGHGTGVASVVAGAQWLTSTADHGHAYGANIAGYAISSFPGGNAYLSTMATAWNTVAADAAANRIVSGNLSYGGSPNPLSVEQKAVDALALNADVLVCTAAGNSGSSTRGSQINVNGISVGAVVENSHTIAGFSSRGTTDGQVFPDMCANGVSTNMARRDNENADYITSGTSFASPQVCGAVTLIRAANRSMRSDETKAVLLASTKASAGTGATQVNTGPGCGYLKDDTAHTIATDPQRHGRVTLTTSSRTWRIGLPVISGRQYQVAIAWHRLNTNSATWSNLDLAVKNGAVTVASSTTARNTEEFVRFTAASTGTYTIEVTSPTLSAASQPFGWASSSDTGTGVRPGQYLIAGAACTAGTQFAVLPRAFASTMGNTGNYFGVGRHNMRYQQLFDRNELPSNMAISAMAYRPSRWTSPGGTTTATIRLGVSNNTVANLSGNFNANFAWTPTTVFNGNLNLPAWTAANTNPNNFNARWAFSRPFYFYKSWNRNLLLEIQNRATRSIFSFADAASGANTSRVFSTAGPTAATGKVGRNYGLIVRFEGRPLATTPILRNIGVPVIGRSYRLSVTRAAANRYAILYIGNYMPRRWLGCTRYVAATSTQVHRTSATGTLSVTRPVPNNRALIGTRYYEQFLILGNVGASGYALTRYGRATIGG